LRLAKGSEEEDEEFVPGKEKASEKSKTRKENKEDDESQEEPQPEDQIEFGEPANKSENDEKKGENLRVPQDWKEEEEKSLVSIFQEYQDRADSDLLSLISSIGDFSDESPPSPMDISNHLLFLQLIKEKRYVALISLLNGKKTSTSESTKTKAKKSEKKKQKKRTKRSRSDKENDQPNVAPKKRKIQVKPTEEIVDDEVELFVEEEQAGGEMEMATSSIPKSGVIEDD